MPLRLNVRPGYHSLLVPAVTEMISRWATASASWRSATTIGSPPRCSRLPKVGGLLDPNVERGITLRPDSVMRDATQKELVQRLERGGIPAFLFVRAPRAAGHHDDRSRRSARGSIGGSRRTRWRRTWIARSPGSARRPRLPHPATLLVFSRDPRRRGNV